MKKAWQIDPQSGGIRIPPDIQKSTTERANAHAAKQAWYPRFQLKIRYKNQFCYLDASENGEAPCPIGRLRYFSPDSLSLAFFTYSNESYQPCIFRNGQWFGTIEQAIDICAMYLI